MENVYFTADLHAGHFNVLKFNPRRREVCGLTEDDMFDDRDAATKKFDEWLIDMWNSTVRREDRVYILGDLCLRDRNYTEKFLQKLHGRKHFVVGNHDKSIKGLERYFESVDQIKEAVFRKEQFEFIDDADNPFCLEMCHFPLLTWNRRPHGTCHIHGHCHNSITDYNNRSGELRLDVGLDSDIAQLGLVSLESIYQHFKGIRENAECNTFAEYTEELMKKQGFRM